MTKAMATHARQMDCQHPPMAWLLTALEPTRARRRHGSAHLQRLTMLWHVLLTLTLSWWQRRRRWLRARWQLGVVWGRWRRDFCGGVAAMFGKFTASLSIATAGERQTSIDRFSQPRGTLMVLLGRRQEGAPHSIWPTCGGFERRRCGLSWSRGRLTLLTRRDPSGDDAMALSWPIFCQRNQAQTMRRARLAAHRLRGPRSARGAADGWHRGDRQRCKLDVAALIRPPRGAVRASERIARRLCAEPARFAAPKVV
jgi:hypothetical protein